MVSARTKAQRRVCPACGRGNAMCRVRSADATIVGRRCRWCGYERLTDILGIDPRPPQPAKEE